MGKLTKRQRQILRKSARYARNMTISPFSRAIAPFWGTESRIHRKLCKRGYYTVKTIEFASNAYVSGWFLSDKGWQALEVSA